MGISAEQGMQVFYLYHLLTNYGIVKNALSAEDYWLQKFCWKDWLICSKNFTWINFYHIFLITFFRKNE